LPEPRPPPAPLQPIIEEHAFKQTTVKRRVDHAASDYSSADEATAVDTGGRLKVRKSIKKAIKIIIG
jgi:hypothetical protein